MWFLKVCFLVTFSLTLSPFAEARVVAIDGVSGFVGSSFLSELQAEAQVKATCFDCLAKPLGDFEYFEGSNYDPSHLVSFLDGVDLFYQLGALASVEPRFTLQQYILTNALSGYLGSRINKSMTLVVASSIAVTDVKVDQDLEQWIQKFLLRFTYSDQQMRDLSLTSITEDLDNFIANFPPPNLKETLYYGLSKLLLERILFKSSQDRSGSIFLVRPALIIGENIHFRQGSSVVKSIMDALSTELTYELWNRNNCFTPVHRLKSLMKFLGSNEHLFSRFEVLDSGCVPLNHHDLGNLILKKMENAKTDHLKYVEYSNFDRELITQYDHRVREFYPNLKDVNDSIDVMVKTYKIMHFPPPQPHPAASLF